MESRLEELARKLEACRMRGNRRTLEYVMESAHILFQAKAIAKRGFGRWLRERGHMEYETARRHLSVARFVEENRSLTSEISRLSIAKIYALSTLDSDTARRYLSDESRFSSPVAEMSDLQFRKEFRERFPGKPRRRSREHVFRATLSALSRAEREVHRASHYVRRMTQAQKRRIAERIAAFGRLAWIWKEDSYRATKS